MELNLEARSAESVWDELTLAVPLYSRARELLQLLASITDMSMLPGELLFCEDCSPDRPLLGSIAAEWKPRLAKRGCALTYVENDENLGYDANVRKLFECANRRWVMVMGNDDVMLPDAVIAMQRFVAAHPSLHVVSRAFVRFTHDLGGASVVTRLADHDRVFTSESAEPGMILRLCGFVSGLLVDRSWAVRLATNRYDGRCHVERNHANRHRCRARDLNPDCTQHPARAHRSSILPCFRNGRLAGTAGNDCAHRRVAAARIDGTSAAVGAIDNGRSFRSALRLIFRGGQMRARKMVGTTHGRAQAAGEESIKRFDARWTGANSTGHKIGTKVVEALLTCA